jgi:hypothetical protein
MLFAAPPGWNAQPSPYAVNPAPGQRQGLGLASGQVVPPVPPVAGARPETAPQLAGDPPRRGFTARGVPEDEAPQAPVAVAAAVPPPAPLTLPPPAALGLAEPPDGTAPVAEMDAGRAHQRLRELGLVGFKVRQEANGWRFVCELRTARPGTLHRIETGPAATEAQALALAVAEADRWARGR